MPDGRLAWRPHQKARTLGELAHAHRDGARRGRRARRPALAGCRRRRSSIPGPHEPSELLPPLDESLAKAKAILGGMDDAAVTATWRLMRRRRELFAVPRVAFLRSVMLNHWYHHRGQLTVYLRELDVAIPSIYGPSADENPFA